MQNRQWSDRTEAAGAPAGGANSQLQWAPTPRIPGRAITYENYVRRPQLAPIRTQWGDA